MKRYRDIVEYRVSGGGLSAISRGVFWVLLGTVVLSPLPFGSIYPWSYTLLAAIVAVLVATWSVTLAISRTSPSVGMRLIWIPVAATGLLAIWISLQAAAWMPAGWHHPAWGEAAVALGSPVQGYISVNPAATDNALMRLLTYAGIFFLAIQYGRSAQNAQTVYFFVAVAGAVYACYGLFVEFSGSETILWYEKERYHDNITSTFRYKNAYATYAGFGLLCAIGLLLRSADNMPPGPSGLAGAVNFISHIFTYQWFLLICFAVMLPALILSDSRAGVASSIVAAVALVIMSRLSSSGNRRHIFLSIAGFSVILLGFIALSGGGLVDRIASEDNKHDVRSTIYEQTIKLISDRPVLGIGYGAFADAFRPVRTDDLAASTARAHNSYLENQLELGAIGMALLVMLFMNFAIRLVRGVLRRRMDKIFPAIGCAAFVLAALHATIDFTLQVPAVTATFFLILGVAYGQSWTSLQLDDSRD